MDPEFDPDTTAYETETANASDTLTVTPEGTSTTVEVRFYESEPDDPEDPQPSEYTVIEPSEGEYTLTWDFTDSDENYIQIVATSEAVEASTWITVAQTQAGGPKLATLGLTGLTLDPEFDPDVHVYAAETDASSVTLTATQAEAPQGVVATINAGLLPYTVDALTAMTEDEFWEAFDAETTIDIDVNTTGSAEVTLLEGSPNTIVLMPMEITEGPPTIGETYYLGITPAT